MSAGGNIELVRRTHAAIAAGDMATVAATFAEDVAWHAAGSGVTSGSKQGRDATMAYLGGLMTRAEGTLAIDVVDIGGSADYAYHLQHSHAERVGKVIDHDVMQVFRIGNGVVVEVWEFFPDTNMVDAFWA